MEFVIIALILAKFCEKGAIDIVSMITGNQPPSATIQKAKGASTEDGPLTRYVKAWWADAIEDLDESRRIKRLETKEEQERARAERKAERQRIVEDAQRIFDAIEEKAAADKAEREARKAEPVPAEEPPHPKDEAADSPPPIHGWDEVPINDEPWNDERFAPKGRVITDEEIEEERRERPEPPAEQTRDDIPVIVEDAQRILDEADPPEASEEAEIFDADIVEEEPQRKTKEAPEELTVPEGPEGPVIPEFKVIQGGRPADSGTEEWTVYEKPQLYAVADRDGTTRSSGTGAQATEGREDMTTQQVANIEGGISAHIDWTAQMAAYQVKAAGHVEMVGATMFRGDNGPERLALVAQIREMHAQMQAAYLRLNSVLVADKRTIGDAYAATNNQAGGKEYTTN